MPDQASVCVVSGGSIEERLADLGRKHVVGRVGRPEEIGEVILFLADSARSGFVTGQSLIADGGGPERRNTIRSLPLAGGAGRTPPDL